MSSLAGPIQRFCDSCWPAVVLTTTVLVMATPTPFPSRLMPDLLLMLVYLTAAFRNDAFPVWLCFVVGLLADLLSGAPPGMQAATFLAIHAFAAGQQPFLRLTQFLWFGFMILAVGTALFRWALLSLNHEVWLQLEPFVTNAAVTALIFPVLSTPLQRLIGGTRHE